MGVLPHQDSVAALRELLKLKTVSTNSPEYNSGYYSGLQHAITYLEALDESEADKMADYYSQLDKDKKKGGGEQ